MPHAIKTAYWPVETYYSVRAELELDGQVYVLEGTGRCDWAFHPFGLLGPGNFTTYGGFLTKVLDDGRAIVIFPGRYCEPRAEKSPYPPPGSLWRFWTMFNQKGVFFFEVDMVTGDIRYPDSTRHDPVIVMNDWLPAVLVLDDARTPKTIRYYHNPREHMATDCASLRIRSYRIRNTSSGAITRRELDVPYLANLKKLEEWNGFMARFVPFSTFDPIPWVREVLERQAPATRLADVFSVRGRIADWRYCYDWDRAEANTTNPEDRWTLRENSTGRKVPWRTIELRSTPPREVEWDPATGVVPLPPRIIGSCPAVTTLFRHPRPARIEFKADATLVSRDTPPQGFRIFPSDNLMAEVDALYATFDPQYFERQP